MTRLFRKVARANNRTRSQRNVSENTIECVLCYAESSCYAGWVVNVTRNIIGSYLIIRGSPSFPSVRANILLSVIVASRFPVSCSTVGDFITRNRYFLASSRCCFVYCCLRVFARWCQTNLANGFLPWQRIWLQWSVIRVDMFSFSCCCCSFLTSKAVSVNIFIFVKLSLRVNDRVSFKSIIKIINQVSIDCVSHARCMSLQWLMSDPMSYA